MQDSFARARTRPSARATIGYLVYNSECDWPLYKKKEGAAELMMKHRSRNLTYSAVLQSFGASPTMKTLFGVRRALKELYALKNIEHI